jgi:hypothetical protein
MISTIEKIKLFLNSTISISIGYNEISFLSADMLDEGQVGYRIDPNGNSLITGNEGDWKEEWLVIAYDASLGDPIFVDTKSDSLSIFTAAIGQEIWEPVLVADSLDNFNKIILRLKDVSLKRTNPVELEANPITEKERQDFLSEIETKNPNSEIWFWETFLEND